MNAKRADVSLHDGDSAVATDGRQRSLPVDQWNGSEIRTVRDGSESLTEADGHDSRHSTGARDVPERRDPDVPSMGRNTVDTHPPGDSSPQVCQDVCGQLADCGDPDFDVGECQVACGLLSSFFSDEDNAAWSSCIADVPCEEQQPDTTPLCILSVATVTEDQASTCEAFEEAMDGCLFTQGFQDTAALFCVVYAHSQPDLQALEECAALAQVNGATTLFNPPPISPECAAFEGCLMDVLKLGEHPAWQ